MVVVTWLFRRSQVSSAHASDAWSRSRCSGEMRARDVDEKHRSRVQNMWKCPGDAVYERPFQVRSIEARMIASAPP